MSLEELREYLKAVLSIERENTEQTQMVSLMPSMSVALKRSMLGEEHKIGFIKAMMKIPNVTKGLSHMAMTNVESLPLEPREALICQALGKAFGVWEIVPMNIEHEEMRKSWIESDTVGMLPMNTGLRVRDAFSN